MISINVDSLPEGYHNYSIIVSDGVGGIIHDSVMVRVNYDPVIIEFPSDFIIENGISLITLEWIVIDFVNSNPTYTILKNGSIIASMQPWNSNQVIKFDIVNLEVGFWNYTIR